MLSYKFRLYPNKNQEKTLELSLDICRQTYNHLLEELNNQTKIERNKIQHKIVELKKINPDMKKVYSKTLQYECHRLFSNLSSLAVKKKRGKKVGKLRFKGKQWFKTMNFNQSGYKLDGNRLYISKIGKIKINRHREINGNIKHIFIKQQSGKWYAILVTDENTNLQKGKAVIGIDLGIINYLVDSNGNKVKNPKFREKGKMCLKRGHQDISRKKKGSNNREKAKKKLEKKYIKITNQRNDFLHKLSTNMIKNNKLIAIEDLNIQKMSQQKHYNARNIMDASWGKFIQMLEYKAESAGVRVIKINPKDTTKTCSKCSNIQDMPLYNRVYNCKHCNLMMDRDYNSAKNILHKALSQGLARVEKSASAMQAVSKKQEALSARLGQFTEVV